MPTTGPFSGITVLDLTRVLAGPYCTMILGDLGARVIKVEMPERGDDARHIGPFVEEKSAYFMSLNRGKESIALDLKDANDRAVFESLLAGADVLVENFRAGTMDRLGYGWDDLHARHPHLIYAAVSGFGHTGPYAGKPAYDMVVQGMGGIMSLTGHPGSPPTRVGSSIGDITAGLFGTIGVVSALYHRAQTGEAMKIDVAMLDAQVAILENAIARFYATGEAPGPIGSRHPSITPFGAFETSNGHIIVAAGNDGLFEKLCNALGAGDLAADDRFLTNHARTENFEALQAAIEAKLRAQPTAHWLAALEKEGIPCAPINNVEQVVNDPQVKARNMIVETEGPDAGPGGGTGEGSGGDKIRMAGNPIKLSGFEDPPTRERAPELDGDREKILRELEE